MRCVPCCSQSHLGRSGLAQGERVPVHGGADSPAAYDLYWPGPSRSGWNGKRILVPATRSDRAGHFCCRSRRRVGYNRVVVTGIAIWPAPAPPPAVKQGLVSLEVMAEMSMAEVTMANMTTAGAATAA